jgi:ADP-ribose pyrophosphatase
MLDYSPFLIVEEHVVELPSGDVISNWPWLVMPDFVNVVAVAENGLFLCFRQVKYGVDGTSLAPVGGYLEPDEDPLAGAKRELMEETGYAAPNWTELGHYRVDGNRGAGMAYLFLARSAYHVTEPNADDLEEQELLYLTRSEMEASLVAGEFKVLSWATAVALALRQTED